MDRQIFIDRMLEAENLTDNLEDEHAKVLMDWGLGQVDGLIAGTQDVDLAGELVSRLMRLMRILNNLAGSPADIDADGVAELVDQASVTFNRDRPVEEAERSRLADQLVPMQPGEALRFLLDWLNQ